MLVPCVVDQSGALFAVALNDREYMLKAARQEDAEMWVAKLNVLKENPQGNASSSSSASTSGGASPTSNAAAKSSGAATASGGHASQSGVRAEDLESSMGGGQTDPNAWAKRGGRLGCC